MGTKGASKYHVRDGQEIFSPQEVKEVEDQSDGELAEQFRRFLANVASRLPADGIVKDTEKAVAGYTRKYGGLL